MIQNHSQWSSPEIIAKFAALMVIALASDAAATPPAPIETQVLGVFTGEGAKLHPANVEPNPIRYYGTDLGFTYEHKGNLVILFGDTMATESGDNIDNGNPPVQDDAYGTIALSDWGEPEAIAPGNIPLILLGQIDGSSQMATIDPGVPMEGFKTPVGGYSNGDSEFGVFYTGKPQGCLGDTDCESGLSCDAGLGYAGQPYFQGEGQTIPCLEGSSPACIPDTMTNAAGEAISGSGFCSDTGSTIWAEEGFGRIAAVGVTHLVGRRGEDNPGRYIETRKWVTNRFLNPSVRTVRDFDPTRGSRGQDYRPASAGGGNSAVFIWGRPAFVGVAAHDRPAGAYFAYAELGEGTDGMGQLNYFSGLDANGKPRFSPNEQDATALDLDSGTPGVQPGERHDVVDQVSVAWIAPLGKWLMFYGGGMTNLPYPPYLPNCGVLEFFAGGECADVVIGDGAFYMRTADNPWGPWTPPAKLIAGGDPDDPKSGQYAPGGMLRHPACNEPTCAPHTAARDINPGEYGFFYSANIIEQWTHKAEQGVAVIWNASTWDPYRVILLRTVISP